MVSKARQVQAHWLAGAACLVMLVTSSPVLADVDCDQSVNLLLRFQDAMAPQDEKERTAIEAAVGDQKTSLALECLCLAEQREFDLTKPTPPETWHLFCPKLENQSLDRASLYNACMTSSCRYRPAFQAHVLSPTCAALGKSTEECKGIVGRKPLSKVRLGVGITLLTVGIPLTILGAVHMGTPVFKTSGGCSAFDLDLPCAAPQFGVGAPLFTLGILATLGGALTLGLPNR